MKRSGYFSLATLLFCMPAQALAYDKPQAGKSLDRAIDSVRIKHNIAAVAYVIVSPDKIIHGAALGVSDKSSKRPVTLDTVFRVGSITKSFTSLALLKLQEQGGLSLQNTLLEHAVDAPLLNPWRGTSPVKIEHLLEHTAGLGDLSRKEFDYAGPGPLTLKQGLFFTPEPRKSLWPPGLHSSYSNAGAGYAAYVLEKVAGRLFEEYVKQEIFGPLEMKQASFYLDEATRKQLATGYDTDGDTVIPYWHMMLRPFGAINTSANEMAHFVRMLLSHGRYKNKNIFNKTSIDRMETPKTTLAAMAGLSFGYGLGSYQHIHNGFVFHGHGGDGDGYLARYAYNRDINRGYFVVINAFHHRALKVIRNKIEDHVIGGWKPTEFIKPVTLPTSYLKTLTGEYREVTRRFTWDGAKTRQANQLSVTLRGKSLQLKLSGESPRELVPASKYHFRYADQPVATMAFIQHEGELYFQGEAGNYQRIEAGKP